MTYVMRLSFAITVLAFATVKANADIILNFDSLANGTIVTDQFRGNGVVFNFLTVISQGTSGVDGSASAPNTAIPSNISTSVFDGKSPSDITSQYGITQQHGFGEAFTDVLFFIDGTNTPGVTNSVSVIVGFDQIFGTNEVNRIVIEAFDSNFSLLDFDVSSRLISGDSETISVAAAGIRGVRLTHSDGLTFDDFRFNNVTAVPEPSSIGMIGILAIFGITMRRRRRTNG